MPRPEVRDRLNATLRGWSGYFHQGVFLSFASQAWPASDQQIPMPETKPASGAACATDLADPGIKRERSQCGFVGAPTKV